MKSMNLPDYTIPANEVPLVEPKRVEKSDLDFLKQRIIDNLNKEKQMKINWSLGILLWGCLGDLRFSFVSVQEKGPAAKGLVRQ